MKSQHKPGFMVGPVAIETPVILAPMEDVTNQPFRRIAKEIANPGLVVTEFVSAMAIRYGAQKSARKMLPHSDERPLAVQIFGSEPSSMADSARLAEELGADILDINMGCWVPKVCKTGSGAALLKDPELAESIVKAVVNAVKIPVTVKVRAGWDYSLFAAPDLTQRFEQAGAKMLTLHARYAKQGFEGHADWSLIAQLKQVLTIPVIGNGDVKTPEDALRMIDETGCDGVMVGRAAIADPWALQRIVQAVRGEPIASLPTIGERIKCALSHLKMLIDFELDTVPGITPAEAELYACRALRGQMPLYVKGVPGAAVARQKITACSSFTEYEDILLTFLESQHAA